MHAQIWCRRNIFDVKQKICNSYDLQKMQIFCLKVEWPIPALCSSKSFFTIKHFSFSSSPFQVVYIIKVIIIFIDV